jgi:transcriptional regulator with XRE-family HTH domain
MQGHTTKIVWNHPVVAKIMKDNGIANRGQLATKYNLSRTTLGRLFDDEWSGRPTIDMIEFLAQTFGVKPSRLICDICNGD